MPVTTARYNSRAARRIGTRFTGPVNCRGATPQVIHESRVSATGPSACSLLSYCIVSAARCAVLEQVSSLPLPRFIPSLCCCSFVRTLVLLRHRYFSLPPLSFLQHLLALRARPSSLSLLVPPRFNSCSFHCAHGEPPNSPVNRPREATSSSSKYCGILSARCFLATVTNARRYKAVVFLWATYISGYDLHNRIIRQSSYRYITNVLFINQLRLCMLHWNKWNK